MEGIESYNSITNHKQVDGLFKNYVLDRVINLECVNTLVDGYLQFHIGKTPINPGELVALQSSTPCAFVSTSNGQLEVHTQFVQSSSSYFVKCYIFTPTFSSSATLGLQVFAPGTQELIYCASKKPISIVGVLDGNGDFAQDMNKSYAVIMLNQYYTQTTSGFNQAGNPTKTVNVARTMVSLTTTGVKVATANDVLWAGPTPPPSGTQPNGTYTSSVGIPRNLLIDVTGY